MPDCSSTAIEIGGTLAADKIDSLVQSIEQEGCFTDWVRDDPMQPTDWHGYINAQAAAGGTLELYDPEGPWGNFGHLEAVCRDLGLSYHRADDGHYAYSASHEVWTPELGETLSCTGQIDDGPQVPLDDLLKAHQEGPEALAAIVESYAPLRASIPPLSIK